MNLKQCFGVLWFTVVASIASTVVIKCCIRNVRLIERELDSDD